jgi:hypothetical protein
MAACDVPRHQLADDGGDVGLVIRGLAWASHARLRRRWPASRHGAAPKIPVDDYGPTIAGAAELAAEHGAALVAPPAYVHDAHDLGRAADAYAAALEESAGGEAVTDAVLQRIAEGAAGIGFDNSAELARLAREAGLV